MAKTSSKQKPHITPENSLRKTHSFKGVRMRKWGKWVSEVRMPNSKGKIWLGSYDTPQQAARAYDCAMYCLRGRKSKFNFPNSLPEIPSASSLSPTQIQAVAAEFAMQELQHPPEYGAAFSGLESQSRVDSLCHQISEEQDWTLLDSLLQDVKSSESLNSEEFPPLDLEDIDFILRPEDDAAISGLDSRSCVDFHQVSEEQDSTLLDSIPQDLESSECVNLEECPPLDLEDIDFVLAPENGGFFPSSHN